MGALAPTLRDRIPPDIPVRVESDPAVRRKAREWIYDYAADVLRGLGRFAYSSEGHLDDCQRVFAAMRRISPKVARRTPDPVPDEPTITEEPIWRHESERLGLRSGMQASVLSPYDDYHSYMSNVPPGEHFFAVARPTRRLLQQYEWDAGDAALLRFYSHRNVSVVLRSSTVEAGVRRVALSPIPLEAAVRFRELPAPVICNISMSTFSSTAWRRQWLPILTRVAYCSVLLDEPPVRSIKRWCELGLEVAYDIITFQAGGIAYASDSASQHCALVCRVTGSTFDGPVVTPISPAFASALEDFLPRRWPDLTSRRTELSQPANWPAAQALMHVAAEEPWTDFSGIEDL